jgi:hypothetical protein
MTRLKYEHHRHHFVLLLMLLVESLLHGLNSVLKNGEEWQTLVAGARKAHNTLERFLTES